MFSPHSSDRNSSSNRGSASKSAKRINQEFDSEVQEDDVVQKNMGKNEAALHKFLNDEANPPAPETKEIQNRVACNTQVAGVSGNFAMMMMPVSQRISILAS